MRAGTAAGPIPCGLSCLFADVTVREEGRRAEEGGDGLP